MSALPSRRAVGLLAALLVLGAVLFAVGAAAERTGHHETIAATASPAASSEASESPGHVDTPAATTGETAGTHSESTEKVLGVNPESTGLVIAASSLFALLAVLVLTRPGRAVLFAAAVVCAVFLVFDIAEIAHQFRISRPGIATLAIAVGTVHLGAGALANQLARRPSQVLAPA